MAAPQYNNNLTGFREMLKTNGIQGIPDNDNDFAQGLANMDSQRWSDFQKFLSSNHISGVPTDYNTVVTSFGLKKKVGGEPSLEGSGNNQAETPQTPGNLVSAPQPTQDVGFQQQVESQLPSLSPEQASGIAKNAKSMRENAAAKQNEDYISENPLEAYPVEQTLGQTGAGNNYVDKILGEVIGKPIESAESGIQQGTNQVQQGVSGLYQNRGKIWDEGIGSGDNLQNLTDIPAGLSKAAMGAFSVSTPIMFAVSSALGGAGDAAHLGEKTGAIWDAVNSPLQSLVVPADAPSWMHNTAELGDTALQFALFHYAGKGLSYLREKIFSGKTPDANDLQNISDAVKNATLKDLEETHDKGSSQEDLQQTPDEGNSEQASPVLQHLQKKVEANNATIDKGNVSDATKTLLQNKNDAIQNVIDHINDQDATQQDIQQRNQWQKEDLEAQKEQLSNDLTEVPEDSKPDIQAQIDDLTQKIADTDKQIKEPQLNKGQVKVGDHIIDMNQFEPNSPEIGVINDLQNQNFNVQGTPNNATETPEPTTQEAETPENAIPEEAVLETQSTPASIAQNIVTPAIADVQPVVEDYLNSLQQESPDQYNYYTANIDDPTVKATVIGNALDAQKENVQGQLDQLHKNPIINQYANLVQDEQQARHAADNTMIAANRAEGEQQAQLHQEYDQQSAEAENAKQQLDDFTRQNKPVIDAYNGLNDQLGEIHQQAAKVVAEYPEIGQKIENVKAQQQAKAKKVKQVVENVTSIPETPETKAIHDKALYEATDAPEDFMNTLAQKQNAGELTMDQVQNATLKLQKTIDAKNSIPVEYDEPTKQKLTPLLVEKNNLLAQIENEDPTLPSNTKEQLAEVQKKIEKITGKPKLTMDKAGLMLDGKRVDYKDLTDEQRKEADKLKEKGTVKPKKVKKAEKVEPKKEERPKPIEPAKEPEAKDETVKAIEDELPKAETGAAEEAKSPSEEGKSENKGNPEDVVPRETELQPEQDKIDQKYQEYKEAVENGDITPDDAKAAIEKNISDLKEKGEDQKAINAQALLDKIGEEEKNSEKEPVKLSESKNIGKKVDWETPDGVRRYGTIIGETEGHYEVEESKKSKLKYTVPKEEVNVVDIHKNAIPYVDKFFERDILPTVKSFGGTAKEVYTGIRKLFDPKYETPTEAKHSVYQLLGDKNREAFIADKNLQAFRKLFNQMPQDELIDFADRYKRGLPQKSDVLTQIAKVLKTIDEKDFNDLRKYRPSLPFKENHLRTIWKTIPGTEKEKFFGSRRPLAGSQGMFKKATLADLSEGIAKGGVPYSYNPITMFLRSHADVQRYLTAQKMWEDLKEKGFVKFAKTTSEIPEGYTPLNDRIAKVYFKHEGMTVSPGEWVVEKNTARILNNYLSKDWIRSSKIGNLGLALKNVTTMFELALSGFHPTFIALDSMSSGIAQGLRQIANGAGFLKGLKSIGESPIQPVRDYKTGVNAVKLLTDKDFKNTEAAKSFLKTYPAAEALINDLFSGGGKLAIHEDYKTGWTDALKDEWVNHNPIGVFLRAIPAFQETIMKPLFQSFIPMLKVGRFLAEHQLSLEENAKRIANGDITSHELAIKNWSFVEDRLGEMNFDNLFWNNTLKSATQLFFRSITWKLGSMRALMGAVPEQVKEFQNAYKEGRTPIIKPKMAWLVGMSVLTAAMNSMIQKMTTGDAPESLKDLIMPKISKDNPRERVVLPTYGKDILHLSNDPATFFKAGLSGMFGKVADVWQNKDFWSEEVYDQDAGWGRKSIQIGEHLIPTPFSIQSAEKMNEEGEPGWKAAMSFMGIQKAPTSLINSKLENDIIERYNERNAGTKPYSVKAQKEAKIEINKLIHSGETDQLNQKIDEYIKAGVLTQHQIKLLRSKKKKDYTFPQYAFTRLPLSDKLHLFGEMSDEEKKQYDPHGKLAKQYSRINSDQ